MSQINRIEGRRAFGLDPAGYDQARPEYPSGVYDLLRKRCGLRSGTRTFEIGPGTGLATKRLLRFGADPLLVVEPDDRSPSSGSMQRPPFAMDVDARIAELNSTGEFGDIENHMIRSSAIFETPILLKLYATFSEISRLHPVERIQLLEKLTEVADKQFNGRVEKPIVTSIYTAQRKL